MKNLTPFLLKALLGSLFIFAISTSTFAQTPDTACAGSQEYYKVTSNLSGSTFEWMLPDGGGTISSGQTTDSINITWGTTPGRYRVLVQELSADGCYGDTMALNVDILTLPTAAMSGDNTTCYGETSTVTVNFTGIPNWSFTYNDGTSDVTVNNITTSPYTFTYNAPVSNSPTSQTYTMVAVNDKYCVGTTSGSATIIGNPKPTTSGIQHN